ncbi:cupin domain-containing protein [Pseudoclavibacter sp. VKM Ac-2888]|uniref:cupin domain-containing protein n=1 Tax=Pseudoclavibacter sp. VKM Ac-2888 TaxID=2783830 RepID=UPI002B26BD33|nr:cupin domain-containing protein [Pseudoclavibacter sp. VKM Ac-2888]
MSGDGAREADAEAAAADVSGMLPGSVVHARGASLSHDPVEGWQKVSGEPTTAALDLGAFAGAEFGLWEMSAGSMLDVEADEVFLVISGTATVEFLEPELPSIDLEPGSIVRLGEGMRTRWTVTGAPLRKLYLVESGS